MPWGATEHGTFEPWTGDGDDLPESAVEAFAASMPPRYRLLFDPRAVRRHALVAWRRGALAAHAEVWRTSPDGSAALCVVAADRAGLLSAIAAALVSHRLDVVTALVFSRVRPDGELEAVDLFWVRRANRADRAPIDAGDATSIGEVLSALLEGTIALDEIAPDANARGSSPPTAVVRFEDVDEDGLAVLVVEAPDRPGILWTIARELFRQGAQIARSLVRTADGRAFNRFDLTELSGAPLSRERRDQIRAAVETAITFA